MASKTVTASPEATYKPTIEDPDLLAWVSAESKEKRELIVEARMPERQVTFQRRPDGKSIPVGIDSSASSDRAETLTQLYQLLANSVDVSPVLLKAAGAIAVKASNREVRKFVDHPLVKCIRSNRRLRKST
ncbi:MAG: hypothetical protein FJ147_14785 [Deltaproteobacteria bacterium]|nr:hypothetical protein [Deltaproteobacteria bacterium]